MRVLAVKPWPATWTTQAVTKGLMGLAMTRGSLGLASLPPPEPSAGQGGSPSSLKRGQLPLRKLPFGG